MIMRILAIVLFGLPGLFFLYIWWGNSEPNQQEVLGTGLLFLFAAWMLWRTGSND
jgi:ABC-type nickel/cobalt efflux system permease component RcnA